MSPSSAEPCVVRVALRVHPGSRRTTVGGAYRGVDGPRRAGAPADAAPALVVRVTARAVDGAANQAVIAALAAATGSRRTDVRLLAGERSRDKLVEITVAAADEAALRLAIGALLRR